MADSSVASMRADLPAFLIVGTMKSGTTALGEVLEESPSLRMATRELHFFDQDDHWASGPAWYAAALCDATRPGAGLLGEKTPTYSYLEKVPPRIASMIPDVKLVWLFRDPVERAYSNYWHAVSRGNEAMSFRSAVQNEDARVALDPFRGYLRRSRYIDQVERYLEHFSLDQMHFIVFEAMREDVQSVADQLSTFLGVPSFAVPIRERVANETALPRSIRAERLAKQLFRGTLPYRVVHRLNRRHVGGYPALDPTFRAELSARFEEPNRCLAELTGVDVTFWPTTPPARS